MAASSNNKPGGLESDGQNTVSSNQYPLVLQCSKCNVIIGDSLAWVCANEALRSLTVSSVSNNVTVGKKLQMSEDGPDMGSSYFVLKCGQCGKELGRRYISTNRDLDELREYFTILVENCNSYQIGSSEQTINLGSLKEDRKYIIQQIKNMQEVMLRMNDRVTGLERALKIEDEVNQSNDSDKNSRLEWSQMNSSMDRAVHSEKKMRMSALGDGSDSGESTSGRKRKASRI